MAVFGGQLPSSVPRFRPNNTPPRKIATSLKGLDNIIELVEVDDIDPGPDKGWFFSGRFGPPRDPATGVHYLRELYQKSDPTFSGRVTIPVLWDKETSSIVNNDSADIIRILYTAFDEFLPLTFRESEKKTAGLFPHHLRDEIESMNTWVSDTVNNGVYKCGFASTQEAYDENIYPLFKSLDRLELHLARSEFEGPYLFGKHITEADIRLFPTLIRFDVGYYMLFKLNLGMIRSAFKKTTNFDRMKYGYNKVKGDAITPAGPKPDIHPL
ncbi:glutathione S-transferase [Fusarium pseudocircinatum]|uniref:Glutathione S-transferase n=1 Tax=Fusarium pseudocircinatum TaxID=56676 RepID=A0A8H5KPU8_9HYPO|nr:glutathione S-transferase [Fusarium pseudocircinatum]